MKGKDKINRIFVPRASKLWCLSLGNRKEWAKQIISGRNGDQGGNNVLGYLCLLWPCSHWQQNLAAAGPFSWIGTMTLYDCVYRVINYSRRFILLLLSTKAHVLCHYDQKLDCFLCPRVSLGGSISGDPNLLPPFQRPLKFFKLSMRNSWTWKHITLKLTLSWKHLLFS